MYAGPGGHRGEFTAWDLGEAKEVWTIKENFPVWSGAVATAGDVVFYGTMEGWFKAVDARTGEVLWQFKTGSGIIGQPITYRGPGRQAVRRGPVRRRRLGGRRSSSGDLDPRDGTAALGFVNAMRDLPDAHDQGGHALCVRAALGPSSRRAAAAARRTGRARASCASAPTPTTCRSPTSAARASRTGSSS